MLRATLASAHAIAAMQRWAFQTQDAIRALATNPHDLALLRNRANAERCLKAARTRYRNAQAALGIAQTR